MTNLEQYTPGPASGAQIRKAGEKWTLILVRELRHSPEKSRQALTGPSASRASGAPLRRRWEPGHGWSHGESFTTVGAPAQRVSETTVTRADAPKVLEYNWGGFDMRWELEALAGGTRLTLWTNIGHRFISMGAAGWHICFDVLDRLRPAELRLRRLVGPEAEQVRRSWQRLNAGSAKQFGVETLNWPPNATQEP